MESYYTYQKSILVYEKQVIVAMKGFKCELCEKVFSTKNKFQRHHDSNHKNNEKVLSCNIIFSCRKFEEPHSHFTQFTKATKITNVNLVVNYFLKEEI